MTTLTPQEKIEIYKNLFRGREDVFAVYWEKADKSVSGYTPACLNEWKTGLCYKLQRQKCKDCPHADYAGLNDYYVDLHLRGQKIYGIYPFFEDKYPAFKSRNVMINVLREAKIIDQFAKEDSFDRLFPNQDELSGKGFGNLIALPMQGKSRENNNTIFLNPDYELTPFDNQWEILKSVDKVSLAKLDSLYAEFNGTAVAQKQSSSLTKELTITVAEQIYISKSNLPRVLVNFLREELNFVNSEFLVKKRMGMSTYKVDRYFKLIESEENHYAIPRGFLSELVNFLNEKNIKFVLDDQRKKGEVIEFENTCKLYDYQQEAVRDMLAEESGVLVAPPGAGKTVMGIEMIARLSQPTLILVHKKQIYTQWLERIENFLNISKREIGQICAGKKTIGKKVTVAMLQTLSKVENFKEELGLNNIGLVLIDECHHIPAKTFRSVITRLNPYYLYGFTATPKRKNNDEKLIYIHLGKILHTVSKNFAIDDDKTKIKPDKKSDTKIIIKNTDIEVPFKVKVDNFQVLSKIITFDSNRNKMIVDDVIKEVDNGNKCLILTERKEHVDVLSYYLKGKYEIITLTGDLTEKQKNEKLKQIEAGNFQILIATGQLIGEGTDFPSLNCLFLVYPFSFESKLIQYIGRIQRGQSGGESTIYDYRDVKIDYLERFFKKRAGYYKKHYKYTIS